MSAARINSNPAYDRAISDYSRVERAGRAHSQRLGSGMRINGGQDDGAHLSVSEGMRAELGGLTEGTRNTEKAMDLLRTAEGGMNEISTILMRMRELATQGTTDTLNDKNREAMDSEFNQLKEYIDRIAKLATRICCLVSAMRSTKRSPPRLMPPPIRAFAESNCPASMLERTPS